MKETNERESALRGMQQAARIAHARAARFGLKIPVWKDGTVVYIEAEPKAQPGGAGNGEHPAPR